MTAFSDQPSGPSARRKATGTSIAAAGVLAAVLLARSLAFGALELPSRLADDEFWALVTDFSEVGGTFPSNNYVSNEVEFQSVIPRLRETVKPGGVYVGVGPDQNFTYITALRPAVAFIVDIRRQNLIHHLLYKALVELAPDREAFVARLFSRPLDVEVPPTSDIREIFDRAIARPPDAMAYRRNLRDVLDQLTRVHGFPLTPDDRQVLDKVYSAFYEFGPEINYAPLTFGRSPTAAWLNVSTPFPSFAELQTMSARDGENHAYLASEDTYAALRDMQLRNLIVPVVGDFAGDRALRAVGDWVRERKAVVTTFYTSNVEQYLFQNNVWREYYGNVATMPIDPTSTFIRSHFPSGAYIPLAPPVIIMPNGQARTVLAPRLRSRFVESSTLLHPVHELLAAVAAAEVNTYRDVIGRSR